MFSAIFATDSSYSNLNLKETNNLEIVIGNVKSLASEVITKLKLAQKKGN